MDNNTFLEEIETSGQATDSNVEPVGSPTHINISIETDGPPCEESGQAVGGGYTTGMLATLEKSAKAEYNTRYIAVDRRIANGRLFFRDEVSEELELVDSDKENLLTLQQLVERPTLVACAVIGEIMSLEEYGEITNYIVHDVSEQVKAYILSKHTVERVILTQIEAWVEKYTHDLYETVRETYHDAIDESILMGTKKILCEVAWTALHSLLIEWLTKELSEKLKRPEDRAIQSYTKFLSPRMYHALDSREKNLLFPRHTDSVHAPPLLRGTVSGSGVDNTADEADEEDYYVLAFPRSKYTLKIWKLSGATPKEIARFRDRLIQSAREIRAYVQTLKSLEEQSANEGVMNLVGKDPDALCEQILAQVDPRLIIKLPVQRALSYTHFAGTPISEVLRSSSLSFANSSCEM